MKNLALVLAVILTVVSVTLARDCFSCQGTGTMVCSSCDGSRSSGKCFSCDGYGFKESTCTYCRGDGRNSYGSSCYSCKGSGMQKERCYSCSGSGSGGKCYSCGGRGVVKCNSCGGSGYSKY